jgi:endonuclease/exonuclease/phosphatase family metal-dependent hydrolase
MALGLLAGALSVSGLLAAPTAAHAEASARKADAVTGLRLAKPTTSGDRAGFTAKWRRTSGARGYRIRWSTSPTMSPATGAGPRGTSYVLRNLPQGVSVCVQVRAKLRSGKGPWSPVVCRTTPRLDRVAPPWVDGQRLEGAPASSVAVTLTWPRTIGATSYQVDWAPGSGDVQRSAAKKTVGAAVSGTPAEHRAIGGLKPNRTYCFQVRAVGRWGTGLRSTKACKITMPLDRGVPASSFGLTMATWNVCSYMCGKWNSRSAAVNARIVNDMDADVVAVQEALNATPTMNAGLTGYTRGCQVGDNNQTPLPGTQAGRQSLFVRTASYAVVPATNRGILFAPKSGEDNTKGACWVELIDRVSGQHVVVVSVHLMPGGAARHDRYRGAQMQALLTAIAARYPAGAPPIVLGGDLNSYRGKYDDQPRVRLEAAGFRDAFEIAGHYGSPAFRSSMNNWSVVPRSIYPWGNHLDHVFASRGVHVASWRIDEPTTPTAAGDRYSQLLSDHSPVVVSLLVPAAAVTPR